MMKLIFSSTKQTTASTYNKVSQNCIRLHTTTTMCPCSTGLYNLSPNICSRSNAVPVQDFLDSVWLYQQQLDHLKWMHPEEIIKDQPSLLRNEICEINKQRPSVIQSVGQVLPLNEAGTVLSLPSKSLDSNHDNHPNSKTLVPQTVTKISVLEEHEEKKHRFYCQFCNKPYHWRSHWKAHERIHTGERPFKCELCGKAFTRSDGLQCHRNTHARKKKLKTSMMKNNDNGNPSEKQKDEGKKNIKKRLYNKAHFPNVEKQFHCHLCRKSFYSSNGLQHHLRQHTEDTK